MERIILFDGVCNLCNSSVQFIIKRDPKGHYKFASLQSMKGQSLLKQYGYDKEFDSFILIENQRIYSKSSAALMICRNLTGLWKLLNILRILPAPFRDFFYDVVAKNRYKWFGKKESCMLPTKEMKKRFLE
ncbi:thiol-disulfide oxidoreductase DCC family protein [Bacillus sp. OK048]|uniref:thiol-disulfide oxidoreductase DCC family protein n=1 Tax=Bacillus sp. OK048 TaxID=1882761 RepID=UPI000888B350|nr:thiol-disulfide oxidoreductase DCC family protein [Bacillus sp. OK048]SDN40721.1 Predicted thiol-disulfide oxidoreductase YuxK, DCC family [Bacillus sp. OK048]